MNWIRILLVVVAFNSWLTINQFTFISTVRAENRQGIPPGYESYMVRPDILETPARRENLGLEWNLLKAAHFSFIAQLLAMYPDKEIYFLARDSEHLYDVAKLVTEGRPEHARIHLLNVSRGNMRHANLREYLAQEGISTETLRAGKQVLFVDTGFAGTIPSVIAELFPANLRNRLKTQLIVSNNENHPSSRVFLQHINPIVNEYDPASMHGTIVAYEHMPRYTDRSTRFVFSNGLWHPVSPQIPAQNDGEVSKPESRRHMQDLRYQWSLDETRARYTHEFEMFERIYNLMTHESAQNAIPQLSDLMTNHEDKARIEAFVRDVIEARVNGVATRLTLAELNLRVAERVGVPNKLAIIQQHPEWAPYLENPDTEIPTLFHANNWQMIGALLDASVDAEINGILLEQLFSGNSEGIRLDMQRTVIENGSQSQKQMLAQRFFSNFNREISPELLTLFIDKASPEMRITIASQVFGPDFPERYREQFRHLIEISDNEVLAHLASSVFSRPHANVNLEEYVLLVLEKANNATLKSLAGNTFSQPQNANWRDALRELVRRTIATNSSEAAEYLITFTFFRESMANNLDLLEPIVNLKTPSVQIRIIENMMRSQAFLNRYPDYVNRILQTGSAKQIESVAKIIQHSPAARNFPGLIEAVARRGNSAALETFIYGLGSIPDSYKYRDAIETVIDRASQENLLGLVHIFFHDQEPRRVEDLLIRLINRGNNTVLNAVAENVLNRDEWRDRPRAVAAAMLVASPQVREELARPFRRLVMWGQGNNRNYEALVRASGIQNRDARATILEPLINPPQRQPRPQAQLQVEAAPVQNGREQRAARANAPVRAEQPAAPVAAPVVEAAVAPQAAVKIKPISPRLRPGQTVEIQDQRYEVISEVGRGRRGVVFQLKDRFNRFRALKVAIDSEPETLGSISRESEKMEALKRLGIPHSVVLVQGENFALKTWVEGIRGDRWLEMFNQNPEANREALSRLYSTLSTILSQGATVGDFRPPNVIYNGRAWVVIDAGSTSTGMTFDQAFARLAGRVTENPRDLKFERRWGLSPEPARTAAPIRPRARNRCVNLL